MINKNYHQEKKTLFQQNFTKWPRVIYCSGPHYNHSDIDKWHWMENLKKKKTSINETSHRPIRFCNEIFVSCNTISKFGELLKICYVEQNDYAIQTSHGPIVL